MHTIVLATQKGGSGKSTLAIGLALAAKQAGFTVRLIETIRRAPCPTGSAAAPTLIPSLSPSIMPPTSSRG